MAKQYDLSLVIKLVDKVSNTTSKVSHSIGKLSDAVDAAGDSASSASFKLSSIAAPIAKTAGIVGSAALGIGAWAAKGALTFDSAMLKIAMSLKGSEDLINNRIRVMRRSIQDLSIATRVEQGDIIDATVAALKSFGDIPTLMNRVEKAVYVGMINPMEKAQDVIFATSAIMHAFGETSEKSYNDLANIMSLITQETPASFGVLASNMGRVAVTAKVLGIDYKEYWQHSVL